MTSRRTLIGAAALPALTGFGAPQSAKPKVVVIGAGAFGGWTALHLRRQGAQVTLVDTWGPGNSRASSGGETRITRATYPDRLYVDMAARSVELWRDSEKRWNRKLYHKIGCIWMPGEDDKGERAALAHARAAGLEFEELTGAQAGKRWPQANFSGVKWMIAEKDAGYLTARRNCASVLEGFLKEGGVYREAEAKPGRTQGKKLLSVKLSDGAELTADQFVFACGPWLGKMWPGVIGDKIRPTRQQVFFFGTPAGDSRFSEDHFPCWIDNAPAPRLFYGIPGNEWRGFKIAGDERGPLFDPDNGDRTPTAEGIAEARAYLAMRFPALAKAPLLEARVCQYENSPDHHFIIDRHPGLENVLLIGGGSGHGYKHGPAVGERAAGQVLGTKDPHPLFQLARFNKA